MNQKKLGIIVLTKNKFITELLKLLFFPSKIKEKELQKTRYNVNVIRPLRNFLSKPKTNSFKTLGRTADIFDIMVNPYGIAGSETNGGSKKIMLDTSLIGTLEGFCNITRGDTLSNTP